MTLLPRHNARDQCPRRKKDRPKKARSSTRRTSAWHYSEESEARRDHPEPPCCSVDDLSERLVAGLSTFLWTDNSPTEAIVQRQASRAKSTMPEATLRWLALRQRWTRRGPQDIKHYPGKDNLMADFPSRSFSEGYPADNEFLTEFDSRFPLPPQLRYWVCCGYPFERHRHRNFAQNFRSCVLYCTS